MPSFSILLLCLFVFTIIAVNHATIFSNNTSGVVSKKNCVVTDYVLALQRNYDQCITDYPTIHGLWPDPESTCTDCTDEVFDEGELSASTLEKMQKYWPTCKQDNTNEMFWDHEWSKHGTCSGLSQEEYFTKTLSLYQQYRDGCDPKQNNCNYCFSSSDFSFENETQC